MFSIKFKLGRAPAALISMLTQVGTGTRLSYVLQNGGGLFMSVAKAISFLVLCSDYNS